MLCVLVLVCVFENSKGKWNLYIFNGQTSRFKMGKLPVVKWSIFSSFCCCYHSIVLYMLEIVKRHGNSLWKFSKKGFNRQNNPFAKHLRIYNETRKKEEISFWMNEFHPYTYIKVPFHVFAFDPSIHYANVDDSEGGKLSKPPKVR